MTAVMVAAVTGAFGVLVALIERGRRQNSREHSDTGARIDRAIRAIGRVEQKVDAHVDDHKWKGAP